MIQKLLINKTTIIIAAFLLLILALSIQTFRANRLKDLKEQAETERDQAIDFVTEEKKKTEIFLNKYNQQVAKTEETQLSLGNAQALIETERLQHLKKVEGLNRKISNLISTSTTIIKITPDSIPKQIVKIPCDGDSTNVFWYKLIDEFNHIEAVVLDSPIFEITVPINTTDYWERKGRFLWFKVGSKSYFREVTSPNKLVSIKAQEYFTIQKKKRQSRKERRRERREKR